MEVPKSLQNGFFFFWRTLWRLAAVFRLGQIVVFPLCDAALFFYLCNVQRRNIYTMLLLHICLDFRIGSSAKGLWSDGFWKSVFLGLHIGKRCVGNFPQFLHIQRDVDMSVHLFPQEKDYCLHMAAPGEQICCHHLFHPEALVFQEGGVPGQGGGVAGDVDQAFGGHLGDGLDGILAQALSWGVYGDDVRADALFLQAQGGLSCVGAEEFCVFDAVAPGIVFGVLNGLGDHLHAQNLSGLSGHGQGDGTHAAVEIQHQVLFGDVSQGDGGFVKPLGLVVVHLVERPGGEPEIQAAEGIFNEAGAVEGLESVAQHGVDRLCIDAENQGGKARYGF